MVNFNLLKNSPDISNIDYQKLISYSQYTIWSNCPMKWKLQYIDKLKDGPNIHLVFGNAVHETLQKYLYDYEHNNLKDYNTSTILKERMKFHYMESVKKNGGVHFSTSEELFVYTNQGILSIDWFISNRHKFIQSGEKLIGIESPVYLKPNENYDVNLIGYMDVVTKKSDGTISIKDIKTSTKGWSKWQKKDFTKVAQLILYKKFLAQQLNVDISKIEVEYIILKREVPEPFEVEFPIQLNRVQSFKPSAGSINVNKIGRGLDEFIEDCFEADGSKKQKQYEARRGNYIESMGEYSNCAFCKFKENYDLCPKENRV